MNSNRRKLGRAVILVLFLCHIALGIYTELGLIEINPLPSWLMKIEEF